MTIATTASAQTVLGNSASTAFTFDFVGVSAGYISVVYTDPSGVSSSINSSDYTLALNSPLTNALWGVGGTLTYPLSGSAIPSGSSLTISRVLPDVQLTTIRNQGAMWPTVVERALDYVTMLVQQNDQIVNDLNDRAYVVPADEAGIAETTVPSSSSRAGALFGWDAQGNPIATSAGITAALVSSFMQPLLLSADTASFESGLNISTLVQGLLTASTTATFEQGLNLNVFRGITAATTLTASDLGKQIGASGSDYYTITLTASTNYATNYWTVIRNDDTARGKKISASGVTAFILWPGQTVTLRRAGSAWKVAPEFQRWAPSTAPTFYVGTTGSDSNDGLHPSAPFLTIQKAVDVINENVDCRGNVAAVSIANGTYAGAGQGVQVYGSPVSEHLISIVGNTSSPSSVIIRVPPGEKCVDAQDQGIVAISGVRFETTGTGSTAISSRQLAVVDVGYVEFGSFASGNTCIATTMASINFTGPYTVDGNMVSFVVATNNAFVSLGGAAVTCTVNGALTFTDWAVASNGGVLICNGVVPFTGSGAGTASTGARYAAGTNGVITLSGTTFPGDTAGTTATGGVVTA